MVENERAGGVTRGTGFGTGLIVLAILLVAVAYPLPATGLDPLFGAGNLFFPLGLSLVALLFGVVGGISAGRSATRAQQTRFARVAISVLVPVGVVLLLGAYLVVVAGFAPSSPFIVGAVVVAGVAGGVVGIRSQE